MKYLCASCERLVEVARFRLDGAQLVLTCQRCGAETRAKQVEAAAEPAVAVASSPSGLPASLPAASSASSLSSPSPPARVVPLHAVPPPTFGGEDPFAVPEGRCPKCIAPRPEGAQVCRQCGLVFANFVPSEQQPSEELVAAWKELASRWDDLPAHDQALAGATVRGELAAMGRLYRIRLARQPMDPVAQRGRDEVLRLAASTSPLVPERVLGPPDVPERARQVLLWSLVVAMALFVGFLVRQLFAVSLSP